MLDNFFRFLYNSLGVSYNSLSSGSVSTNVISKGRAQLGIQLCSPTAQRLRGSNAPRLSASYLGLVCFSNKR